MPQPPQLPPVADAALSVVLLPGNSPDADALLAAWAEHLGGLAREWEIILVEPATEEEHTARVATLAERHPGVRLVRHEGPPGEGSSLRQALLHARQTLLFYTLLDPRFRPADLDLLLHKRPPADAPGAEIDHVHLISGYRAGRQVPLPLRLLGFLCRIGCRVIFSHTPPRLPGWLGWRAHLGRFLVRALFGVRYHDVACPFRLLRREDFDRMVLQSDGPFVHVEILAKSNFLGHVIGEEVPLASHPPVDEPRPGGSLSQRAREFYRVLAQPEFAAPAPAEPKGTQAGPEPAPTAETGPDPVEPPAGL
jgi:hypothetical protein